MLQGHCEYRTVHRLLTTLNILQVVWKCYSAVKDRARIGHTLWRADNTSGDDPFHLSRDHAFLASHLHRSKLHTPYRPTSRHYSAFVFVSLQYCSYPVLPDV